MKNAWKSLGTGAVLLMSLTVVAYLPSLRGEFVFDDHELIAENPMLQAKDGLYRFWFTAESPDYRPMTWSLWWLERRLWGTNPIGYHVVNVLLHAVDSVLVWLILRRLRIPAAWLAAAVFAVHPVNVATVAWVSEQKNTLSMLFYALAILLYLRFDEVNRWRWYMLSLAAFFLALLSKTAVVMLPVALLGCVWWVRGRIRRRDWLCCVPYFAASLILAVVTIVQHHRALGGTAVRTGGFASRLVTAGCVPWFYLSKALLPFNLTVIYPRWEIGASHWVSFVPGIVLIGGLFVFWWKRQSWGRPLLFGLGYFVVMLFPVLGFFDQAFYRYSLVADHWQYFSIVGVIALVVAAGKKIGDRIGKHSRNWGAVMGMAVLTVLAVATWRRSWVYADDETLWRDNAAKNPHAWLAYYNIGVALEKAGRMEEAIAPWEQALRIKPDYIEAHYNLGIALGQLGREEDAIGHWEQALRIKPDFAEAQYNLGVALLRVGRTEEAMEHWEQALRIDPDLTAARIGLARLRSGQ